MNRLWISLVVSLCCTAFVLADGLVVQGTGTVLDPAKDSFGFSTQSGDIIGTCTLLIDGEIHKVLKYDSVLKGRVITMGADDVEEGDHTWQFSCTTDAGAVLTTPLRNVTIQIPEESVVKVAGSGTTRGSMRRTVTLLQDSQESITIPKIATGDYIEVIVETPAGRAKKDMYVRARQTTNGTMRLWLTQKQENIYLPQGENVTVTVGTASAILRFDGLSLNRAIVTVFPHPRTAVQEPTEEPEIPDEPKEPVVDTPPVVTPPQPPADGEETDVPEQKPGAVRRFFLWLAGLFG